MLGGGAAVMLAGGVIGMILALQHDRATIEVLPALVGGTLPLTRREGTATAAPSQAPGLAIRF
jgi:hypothetical protein